MDAILITLRFVLRNPHADQGTGEAAGCRADRSATERRHDRARRDERAYARNRDRARADEPAQCPTEHTARGRARRRAFGSLGVLLVREFLAGPFVGHHHRDVVAGEPCGLQLINDSRGLLLTRRDAEDGLVAAATITLRTASAWLLLAACRTCRCGLPPLAGALHLDVFFANTFLHILALRLAAFADAHFFANMRFFLHNRFFPAKRNVNFLLLERLPAGLCTLASRNAFNHNFLALKFHRLIHNFRAHDLPQTNAAVFHLPLANLQFFLAQRNGGMVATTRGPRRGLPLCLRLFAPNPVVGINVLFGPVVQFNTRIVRRRRFDSIRVVRQANAPPAFTDVRLVRRNDMRFANQPSGAHTEESWFAVVVCPKALERADFVAACI